MRAFFPMHLLHKANPSTWPRLLSSKARGNAETGLYADVANEADAGDFSSAANRCAKDGYAWYLFGGASAPHLRLCWFDSSHRHHYWVMANTSCESQAKLSMDNSLMHTESNGLPPRGRCAPCGAGVIGSTSAFQAVSRSSSLPHRSMFCCNRTAHLSLYPCIERPEITRLPISCARRDGVKCGLETNTILIPSACVQKS